jgi:cytoskeleton protein RodZ
MPDNTNADTILLTPEGATISPSTAGALLKAARQQAGVHLAVLSVNLKVPVRQLEALEADQYPADQSPVFARALGCQHVPTLACRPGPCFGFDAHVSQLFGAPWCCAPSIRAPPLT